MYEKILVPLDGSELAECALPHVKEMVTDGAAGEVTLLNVVNVSFVYSPASSEYPGRVDINAIRESLFTKSRRYLAEVESRLVSEGVTVKTESIEGNRPADTISEYARNNGMDLIVIATHGYTGLKKLMLGSVALGVLHESHIPVLLIRPESCR
ncbi:MAG: universal stress protein [Deltaproteobacteria bacterium]|nr:universal stress protein [Deltaproteobacteria bacterium]